MPRGQPDFGMYAAKEVASSVSDMGEVAARLGSIVIYDKRGDVVDFDNFEEPVLKWSHASGYGTGYARFTSSSVKSASQAVLLGVDTGTYSDYKMYKYRSILASDRLGAEISFSKMPTNHLFRLQMIKYDGTTAHQATIVLDSVLKKIYALTPSGGEEDIVTGIVLYSGNFVFYTLKLVVDFSTDKFVRLMFAQTEYDISSYSLRTSSDTTSPMLEEWLQLTSKGSDAGEVTLDDYILTQAEP